MSSLGKKELLQTGTLRVLPIMVRKAWQQEQKVTDCAVSSQEAEIIVSVQLAFSSFFGPGSVHGLLPLTFRMVFPAPLAQCGNSFTDNMPRGLSPR